MIKLGNTFFGKVLKIARLIIFVSLRSSGGDFQRDIQKSF